MEATCARGGPVTRPSLHLAEPVVATTAESVAADVDLERAVAALSSRQRLAVDLYYFVGLDVATCAQVMGCAEGTVKATLHQARGRLRALLGEDFAGGTR
jgi:RNA polymerase sigma factor (sigma-70 family)